jgi:hypothetical protein
MDIKSLLFKGIFEQENVLTGEAEPFPKPPFLGRARKVFF